MDNFTGDALPGEEPNAEKDIKEKLKLLNLDQSKGIFSLLGFFIVAIAVLLGSVIISMSIFWGERIFIKQMTAQVQQASGSKELASTSGSPTPTPTAIADIQIKDGVPVLGSNDAPVTIIEFADFQCPFCKEFHDTVFSKLKDNYISTGKVKFAFEDFAFLGDESVKAAEAAKCAQDQGKFWEYNDALYAAQQGENRGTFSDQKLTSLARQIGLNVDQFSACTTAHTHQSFVQTEQADATAYGISATPSFFINGKKIEGVIPYDGLAGFIDQQIKK